MKIFGEWQAGLGQIIKPVRKKAGLLWKLLQFKIWKRTYATRRQSLQTLSLRSSLWKYAKIQVKLTLHERLHYLCWYTVQHH